MQILGHGHIFRWSLTFFKTSYRDFRPNLTHPKDPSTVWWPYFGQENIRSSVKQFLVEQFEIFQA